MNIFINILERDFSRECKNNNFTPYYEKAIFLYLEVLRVFLNYEKDTKPFERTRDFQFATEEEISESHYAEEYRRFRKCIKNQYFYELMRIGKEIMPFDSLATYCRCTLYRNAHCTTNCKNKCTC